jgi:Holliday junction DNA helicase RuvA
MITGVRGVVNRVLDEEVRLQVGPVEYQVLVPEFVRRQLQTRTGEELTLHTTQFFEGNQVGSRFVPRLVGFLHDSELEFFELFCTVDKIGAKKALKALARPVRDIADAILRQDAKWLTTLPGVGAATAEQIISTLRRKVTTFTLAPAEGEAVEGAAANGRVNPRLLEDVYAALTALGLGPLEARGRLDRLLASGKSFATVEEALAVYFQLPA